MLISNVNWRNFVVDVTEILPVEMAPVAASADEGGEAVIFMPPAAAEVASVHSIQYRHGFVSCCM